MDSVDSIIKLVRIAQEAKLPNEKDSHLRTIEDLLVNHKASLKSATKKAEVRGRVEEHSWYEENEVYQLDGKLFENMSVRVVKKSDIKDRLAQLQESEGNNE